MDDRENENDVEEKSRYEELMEMCKILYQDRNKPMTQTCMCWGFECGEGWYEVLKRLSCELEALNLQFYDKYKVRIQADQVKEKFGTLHFYYSVVCDNYTEEGLRAKAVIDDFEEKNAQNYFGIKTIVDKKGYTSDEVDEKGNKHSVWHPPVTHSEATKNVEEFEAMKKEQKAAYDILREKGYYDMSDEQKVIIEYLENEAFSRVRKAEDDCYNVCEDCGSQIGTDWSPRCETTGWITYKCEKCAKKTKTRYLKDGALYEDGTLIKSKEQLEKEREEIEAKYEARRKKDKEDEDQV